MLISICKDLTGIINSNSLYRLHSIAVVYPLSITCMYWLLTVKEYCIYQYNYTIQYWLLEYYILIEYSWLLLGYHNYLVLYCIILSMRVLYNVNPGLINSHWLIVVVPQKSTKWLQKLFHPSSTAQGVVNPKLTLLITKHPFEWECPWTKPTSYWVTPMTSWKPLR